MGSSKEYKAQHYLDNKELYIARSKASNVKNRRLRREQINTIKTDTPCSRCGNKFHHAAMDFHHVVDDKENDIATMVNQGLSLKRIQTEIEKCILLCANCHRVMHYDLAV